MSGFKFSFNIEKTDEQVEVAEKKIDPETKWLDASEIEPPDDMILKLDEIFPKAKMYLCGDVDIGHVYSEDAIKYLLDCDNGLDVDNNVISADFCHSDLVKGKYEGGMKIWECTLDLAEYLEREKIPFDKTNTIDLGCGAGILGILALLKGANVHFQDYNKEVIHSVTVPNCLLNIKEDERKSIKGKCKFFCGDWESLSLLMDDETKYDYILSSETIYNVDSYGKLYNFVEKHLKHDGTAFIAAKTYYFGVGGSIGQFEDFVKEKSAMKCEVCWKSSSAVVREILKITFK